MRFQYLVDKITHTPFCTTPFKHLEILDFFTPEDFAAIISSPEVALRRFTNDQDLLDGLREAGYQPTAFPGTTTDVHTYLAWHSGQAAHPARDTCEGFGMTFRLRMVQSPILTELTQFFLSQDFVDCVASKFGLAGDATKVDGGLQKYLDGYEISPHPDVRRKALTYMINVNPDPDSHRRDFHTHYMRFVPAKRYVQEHWRYNPDTERCWVPWDWCETSKQQTRNNSVVMFSPDADTLHAVRAHYDHLSTQRTQFYGNLWYTAVRTLHIPSWRDYVILSTPVLHVPRRRTAASESSR